MKLAEGRYLASTPKALKRLQEYVAYAERGDKNGLLDALERNVLDHDAHPNAVIYEACRLITGLARGAHASALPVIQKMLDDVNQPTPPKS